MPRACAYSPGTAAGFQYPRNLRGPGPSHLSTRPRIRGAKSAILVRICASKAVFHRPYLWEENGLKLLHGVTIRTLMIVKHRLPMARETLTEIEASLSI